MNTVTISGFLGKAAESKTLPSGKTVTNLTFAHTPREKRGDEWVDGETIWFKVPVWDDLPAVMFDKGTRVVVTGQLNIEFYEKEGETRQNLVIKNATVGIVHRFNQSTATSAVNDDWAVPASNAPAYEQGEDIPF